jgi:hypothetical protein
VAGVDASDFDVSAMYVQRSCLGDCFGNFPTQVFERSNRYWRRPRPLVPLRSEFSLSSPTFSYYRVLSKAKRFLACVPNGLSFVKTVLNNLWTHIGFEDDGRLVHTDKKTGVQFVSVKTWPSLMAARQALDAGFSKIEW